MGCIQNIVNAYKCKSGLLTTQYDYLIISDNNIIIILLLLLMILIDIFLWLIDVYDVFLHKNF